MRLNIRPKLYTPTCLICISKLMSTLSRPWSILRDLFRQFQVKAFNARYLRDITSLTPVDIQPLAFPVENSPIVSIVIPIFNKWQFTYYCLQELLKHTKDVAYEVVVVDNASTDETSAIFKHVSGIQYLRNQTNLGFAKACNQGARAARGQYVVFLNNDTAVQSGWLTALVDELQTHPETAAVGGRLLYRNDTIQHAGIEIDEDGTPFHPWARLKASDQRVSQRRRFLAVTGACLMMSREEFLSTGGFDEKFINGLEDVDLCLRLASQGRQIVYRPDCVVYHFESLSHGRFLHAEHNTKLFRERWSKALAGLRQTLSR